MKIDTVRPTMKNPLKSIKISLDSKSRWSEAKEELKLYISPFFRLPPEIRRMIYDYILLPQDTVAAPSSEKDDGPLIPLRPRQKEALTCYLVTDQVSPFYILRGRLFYSLLNFWLRMVKFPVYFWQVFRTENFETEYSKQCIMILIFARTFNRVEEFIFGGIYHDGIYGTFTIGSRK